MEKEKIVSDQCNCLKCQSIREKQRKERVFMSFEEMFDILDKKEGLKI